MMALSMSKWVGFLFRASGDCGEGTTKTFPCVPCGVGTGPKRTSICRWHIKSRHPRAFARNLRHRFIYSFST